MKTNAVKKENYMNQTKSNYAFIPKLVKTGL